MRRTIAFATSLAIGISLIYVLFEIGHWAWLTFSTLPKEIAAPTVTAAGTILVSVLSVVGAKAIERKREIEREIREQKIPIYQELLQFLMRIFHSAKDTSQNISQGEMVTFMYGFTQKIMIWGSDDVIAKWVVFRKQTLQGDGVDPVSLMLVFEDLILAIRKDTGHSNAGIKQGDLLSLFVNDIAEVLDKRQATKA